MFRSEVSVLSFISVEDREGSLTAQLTGVSLELYCVLLTNMTASQQAESNIRISHFSVYFLHQNISQFVLINYLVFPGQIPQGES